MTLELPHVSGAVICCDVAADLSGLDLTLKETDALSGVEREALLALFRGGYRQANPRFLEKSLETLRWVALAHREGRPVGFGLGETRVMDLPRLPAQIISLAGLCCIRDEFRRRGLFGRLEQMVLTARELPAAPRRLFCGRMAHPAALRTIARFPTVLPKVGRRRLPGNPCPGPPRIRTYELPCWRPLTMGLGANITVRVRNICGKDCSRCTAAGR